MAEIRNSLTLMLFIDSHPLSPPTREGVCIAKGESAAYRRRKCGALLRLLLSSDF